MLSQIKYGIYIIFIHKFRPPRCKINTIEQQQTLLNTQGQVINNTGIRLSEILVSKKTNVHE